MATKEIKRLIVVGLGYAAASFVDEYRKRNQTTNIALISKEAYSCYDRRKLVDVVVGKKDVEDLIIYPQSWYRENQIDLALKTQVINIDRERGICALNTGTRLPFQKLIIATGANANRLNVFGNNIRGVFYLREAIQAIQIRRFIANKGRLRNIVIGGAGPLGVEMALTLRAFADRVFLLEQDEIPLAPYLDSTTAEILINTFDKHGVTFCPKSEITSFTGRDKLESVNCKDRQTYPADMAIVCAGASHSKSRIIAQEDFYSSMGVQVNFQLCTKDEDIMAIGDAIDINGQRRLNGWANANITGRFAARYLLANDESKPILSPNAVLNPMILDLPQFNLISIGMVNQPDLEQISKQGNNYDSWWTVFTYQNMLSGGVFFNCQGLARNFIRIFGRRRDNATAEFLKLSKALSSR